MSDDLERGHTLDLALAAACAYGAALGVSRLAPNPPAIASVVLTRARCSQVATRVDPRRRGAVASSKGTLSK